MRGSGLVLSLEKWAIFTTKSRKMRGYEDWFNKVHNAQAQAPSVSRGLPIASPAELLSSGGNDSELPNPVEKFTEAGQDMDKEAGRLLRHIQVGGSASSSVYPTPKMTWLGGVGLSLPALVRAAEGGREVGRRGNKRSCGAAVWQEEELLSFKGTSVFQHRPNPADALRRAQEKTPPPHHRGYAKE